jgi:hypothetical protein
METLAEFLRRSEIEWTSHSGLFDDAYYGILLKHDPRPPEIVMVKTWSWAKGAQIGIQPTNATFSRYCFVFDKDGQPTKIDRNNEPPSIEDEISLQELIASSEEIYGIASHLSPEMYSRIERSMYNKLKEAFSLGHAKRAHDVFTIALKELKDGIKFYEQRTGKS